MPPTGSTKNRQLTCEEMQALLYRMERYIQLLKYSMRNCHQEVIKVGPGQPSALFGPAILGVGFDDGGGPLPPMDERCDPPRGDVEVGGDDNPRFKKAPLPRKKGPGPRKKSSMKKK
jgi:hypothetical protein